MVRAVGIVENLVLQTRDLKDPKVPLWQTSAGNPMTLRYRQMRPNDVGRCVDILAAHPVNRPRYGSAISELGKTWLRLLGSEAFTAVVFEELHGDKFDFLGAGVSVFVSDAFLREIKTPPFFWIGPEIVRRISRGDSPVLSDRQLREANTRGELNLIGWHAVTSVENARRVEVLNFVFGSFIELHRGFFIKELIGQADSPMGVEGIANSGGGFFDAALGRFVDSLPACPEQIVNTLHVMGETREMAFAKPWLLGTSLFSYQRPVFAFRRSEQRLLAAALQGGTDEDLAEELGVSLSFVRRTWLSIYDRVGTCLPEFFAEELNENGRSGRGKRKKYRLLAYVRDHPEELRPLSRKLLLTGGMAAGTDG